MSRKIYDWREEIFKIQGYRKVAVIGSKGLSVVGFVKRYRYATISLFIPAGKNEAVICREWRNEISKKMDIDDSLDTMWEIVDFLLDRNVGLLIAGLENAEKVAPSFFKDLRKAIARHKDANIAVAISSIKKANEIIVDETGPLNGIFDVVIKLNELDFSTVYKIMKGIEGLGYYSIEDIFIMWSVFGGRPKYYALLSRQKPRVIDFIREQFFECPHPLFNEVKLMLMETLGKEYKTYFSVLQAISEGYHTLNDIAEYIGVKTTDITKYVSSLLNDHELLYRRKDVFGNGNYRYYISSNLIEFWFRFVWKNYSLYKLGGVQYILKTGDDGRHSNKLREGEDIPFPKEEFNEYLNRKYKELVEAYVNNFIYFKANNIGKLWIEGPDKQKFEVDIVAAGKNKLAAFDVSWSELNDKIIEYKMNTLREKLELLDDERKKQVIVVGKSVDEEMLKKYNGTVHDIKKLEKIVATLLRKGGY